MNVGANVAGGTLAQRAQGAPRLDVALSDAEPESASFVRVRFPKLIATFPECFRWDGAFTARPDSLSVFKHELAKLLGDESMKIASVHYIDGYLLGEWREVEEHMRKLNGDLVIEDGVRFIVRKEDSPPFDRNKWNKARSTEDRFSPPSSKCIMA